MLRRLFVFFLFFAWVMVGGSMLFAQSPETGAVNSFGSLDSQSPFSVDAEPGAFENEDQEFAMPFPWDISPGMDEEFRYPSTYVYQSAATTKSAPEDVPAIIPEPGTMVLMAAGLAALGVRRMRLAA